jgi:hypothetical protein
MLFSIFRSLENDNGLMVFFIATATVHRMTSQGNDKRHFTLKRKRWIDPATARRMTGKGNDRAFHLKEEKVGWILRLRAG